MIGFVGSEKSRIISRPPGLSTRAEFINGFAPIRDVADAEGDGQDVSGTIGEQEAHRIALEETMPLS